MDAKQFQKEVVDPTLKTMGMYSEAASQLLMGVMMQESRGEYVKQLGSGPALGFFQMEPFTHDDIWKNYLKYKKTYPDIIRSFATLNDSDTEFPNAQSLMDSLPYQVAMARAHFLRVRDPLPKAGDINGMAAYWKKFYNTAKGKGTEEEFIKNFPVEIL